MAPTKTASAIQASGRPKLTMARKMAGRRIAVRDDAADAVGDVAADGPHQRAGEERSRR